jgi:hypothetical protein
MVEPITTVVPHYLIMLHITGMTLGIVAHMVMELADPVDRASPNLQKFLSLVCR